MTEQTHDQNWHDRRRLGIGGSDAAAIVELSPWKKPIDVFCDKLGLTVPDQLDNDQIRWGRLMEPVVLADWTLRTGRKTLPRRFFTHRKFPWLVGNVDACVEGVDEGAEVKTSMSGEGWGAEGTDEIPIYYLTQCHHYMLVTGWKRWHVIVLIGGSIRKDYVIEKDEMAEQMLFDAESEFWHEHVLKKNPPEVTSYSKEYALWLIGKTQKRAMRTDGPNGDFGVDMVLTDVINAYLLKQKTEEDFNAAKFRAIQVMAANGVDELYSESGKALWRPKKGRLMTNWPAIVEEAKISPEIVAKHTKHGEPSDFFKVTPRLVSQAEYQNGMETNGKENAA